MLDDHTIGKVIETGQSELVLETTYGGRACVTRIFLGAVPLAHDAVVRDACLRGATLPDGLSGELVRPGAIAAGVSASVPRLVEAPPRGHGYAYVTVPVTAADATIVDASVAPRTIVVSEQPPVVHTIVVPDDPIPSTPRPRTDVLEPASGRSAFVVVVLVASGALVLLSCAILGFVAVVTR